MAAGWAATGWAAAGLAALSAGWAAAAVWQASRPVLEHLVFRQRGPHLEVLGHRRLPCGALPPPPVGLPLRLVHISDPHLHRRPGPAHRRGLAAIRRLRPHLVVMTGDFVDRASRRSALEAFVQAVARLAPSVAVLGNHDLERPAVWAMVVEVLGAAGVRLVENGRVRVSGAFGELEVVGVGSPDLGLDDLDRALSAPAAALTVGPGVGAPTGGLEDGAFRSRQPSGQRGGRAGGGRSGQGPGGPTLRITLAHSYHVLEHVAPSRCGALVLVGDTHGGQVVLPGLGPVWATWVHRHRYIAGLYRVDQTWLYVNRGLGTIGPPIRWRCPPEIAIIDLWLARQ